MIVGREPDLVAVAKPPGVAVIPARGEAAGDCLRARVEAELGERLWVVHRLDRDTSGIVLFARSAAAHRALSLDFEHGRVGKLYLAYTAGSPEPPAGRIVLALHAARRGKTRPAAPGEPGAKPAASRYRVRRRWRLDQLDVARLEVEPESGRQHRIRVHLRSLGAPILFDRLYGGRASAALPPGAPLGRLALHALRLTLPAPVPGAARRGFEAPLPADLANFERWLEASSPAEALR